MYNENKSISQNLHRSTKLKKILYIRKNRIACESTAQMQPNDMHLIFFRFIKSMNFSDFLILFVLTYFLHSNRFKCVIFRINEIILVWCDTYTGRDKVKRIFVFNNISKMRPYFNQILETIAAYVTKDFCQKIIYVGFFSFFPKFCMVSVGKYVKHTWCLGRENYIISEIFYYYLV